MSIREKNAVTMDTIVALCKRRGFVFPSAEIYGGFANAFDFGPLGVEMKRNLRELWWRAMVQERDDIVGIEGAMITNPRVWVASGHVEGFNDPLVECRNCHTRYRADDLPGAVIGPGGQATVPLVNALKQVAPVEYAEIVATIASKSAGPGTRQNIDEFTETTARGLEIIGRANHGKAIIVLNPAEPPILMRNTVHGIMEDADSYAILKSIEAMVARIQQYIPGYRLRAKPLIQDQGGNVCGCMATAMRVA